jgi:hypothetical protein
MWEVSLLIDEALEQPTVAELNDEYLRDTYVEGLNQPAQEPVAWMNDIAFSMDKDELTAEKFGDIIPLYTHPYQWQGNKEFVRLTDGEILDLEQKYTDLLVGGGTMFHFEEFARAIEQVLKEKNNA